MQDLIVQSNGCGLQNWSICLLGIRIRYNRGILNQHFALQQYFQIVDIIRFSNLKDEELQARPFGAKNDCL